MNFAARLITSGYDLTRGHSCACLPGPWQVGPAAAAEGVEERAPDDEDRLVLPYNEESEHDDGVGGDLEEDEDQLVLYHVEGDEHGDGVEMMVDMNSS